MQNITNKTFILFAIIIFVGLIYLLAPILTPFVVGALLAYLADPCVAKLRSWHVPNLLSVIFVFFLVFLILFLMILLLIPLIEKQIALLATAIPDIVAWIQNTLLPWLSTRWGVEELLNIDTLKSTLALAVPKAGSLAAAVLKTMVHSGYTLILWLVNLILIPVVTFYLLRDWAALRTGCRNLLPRSIEPTVVKLTRECNEVLSAFFRGQLLVMLGLGCIYSVGLSLIGLQIGIMIGLIAGLASIVPYLGFVIGISAASIAALVQFGTWHALPWVLLVFVIGQCAESMVLTPYLIGNRIGLHPVAVIFAVLAGGTLFGFFGVLLALPVASVIMVWIRFLNKHYRTSQFYKK